MVNIESINTASPFRDLFPIEDNILKEIYWEIQKKGFDESKPIVIWKGKSVVIDGHTRLRAARKAGLSQIPAVLKDFDDIDDALEYAIKCQRNRRNLRDKEIIKCIAELDKKRDRGGNHGNQYTGGKVAKVTPVTFAKSSVETGKILGIGRGKVEKVRKIMDEAPEEIKEAVKNGDMSINSAYKKIVHPEKKETEQKSPSPEPEVDKVESFFRSIKEKLANEKLTKEEIEKLITLLVEELCRMKGEVAKNE